MKVIKPSFRIIQGMMYQEMLHIIEGAYRVCYASDKMGDSEEFIRSKMKLGHLSPLEHCVLSVEFYVNRGVTHEMVRHRIASFSQQSTRYCVAGDTILNTKNPHYKMTVKDLYNKVQTSKNGQWKRINIKQINDITDEICFSPIKNIFKVGEKNTVKITTKLGYTLTATKDHNVLTDEGYVKISDLKKHKIAVNGTNIAYKNKKWLFHQYNTLEKTAVNISDEFGFNISTIKKWVKKHELPQKPKSYWNKGRVPWNKGKQIPNQIEALEKYRWTHGRINVDKKDRVKKLSKQTYHKIASNCCGICANNKTLQVHHIDNNRNNNHTENLITLCSSCHGLIHNKNLNVVYYDDISSIEQSERIDVYDIEMNSIYPNFVANGIVVHNCNFSKDKFGNEISVIEPLFFDKEEQAQELEEPYCFGLFNKFDIWLMAMNHAEWAYLTLLKMGATPQEARDVLPNALTSKIVITANIREWRLIMQQRAIGTTGKPHPAMVEVMLPLLEQFQSEYPVFFEDLISLKEKNKCTQ